MNPIKYFLKQGRKKEDFKRHFRGEKIGSGNAVNKFLLISILIFCFCRGTYPQVSLGDFIGIKHADLPEEFSAFEKLQGKTNQDSYLIYSPKVQSCRVISFSDSLKKNVKLKYQRHYPISKLIPIGNPALNQFLFFSAKKNILGVLKLLADSSLKVETILKVKNIPGEFCNVDLNKDGNLEVFGFGANYGGLLLIDFVNKSWRTRVFEKETSFSIGAAGDFNNDDVPDFAGINIKNSSICYLINNQRNEFYLARTRSLIKFPDTFIAGDVNRDGYTDIVYTSQSSCEIIYGDSVHSYESKKNWMLPNSVSKIGLGDFNEDKRLDLWYCSSNMNDINIMFQNTDSKFSPPITYFYGSEVVDIKTVRKDKRDCICFLSGENLSLLCPAPQFRELDRLPFGRAGSFFARSKNLSERLIFVIVNKQKKALEILYSTSAANYVFADYPVFGDYDDAFYDFEKNQFIDIMLFDRKKRNLQFIKIDLKLKNVERKYLPFDGNLMDADFVYPAKNEKKFALLLKQGNKVEYTVYETNPFGKKISQNSKDSPNCLNGKIVSFSNVILSDTYMNTTELMSWYPLTGKTISIEKTKDLDGNSPDFYIGDFLANKKFQIVNIYNDDNEFRYKFLAGKERKGRIKIDFPHKSEISLSDGSVQFSSPEKGASLFFYDENNESLYTLNFYDQVEPALKPVAAGISISSMLAKHIGKGEDYIFMIMKDSDGMLVKRQR